MDGDDAEEGISLGFRQGGAYRARLSKVVRRGFEMSDDEGDDLGGVEDHRERIAWVSRAPQASDCDVEPLA